MSAGFDLTPELLTQQGRTLRALARSLLADEHAAEDVVQETWVACLRHPGALPERVSAWLGTVARRMALRRVRGEARRDARERFVAAHERVEAAQVRSLEHEEALRAVMQALAALEEPFKTVVWLRFHEERTPAEIARELDVPLATVKSRLARGLEQLRARLGRELGVHERQRVLLLAAGTRAVVGLAGVSLGASLVAVLVLSGALFGLWHLGAAGRGALDAASAPGGVSLEPAAFEATAAAPEESGTGGTREGLELGARATPTGPMPGEARFGLSGRVVDGFGLPLEGATILLAPQGLGFNRAARTDAHGRFALTLAGRGARLACALAARTAGSEALDLVALELVAGRTFELELALGTGASLPFLAQVPLIGGFFAGPSSDSAPSMRLRDGVSCFVDVQPSSACARPRAPQTLMADSSEAGPELLEDTRAILRERLGEGAERVRFTPTEDGFVMAFDPAPEEPTLRVHGVVRDELGAPLAGALVGWSSQPDLALHAHVESGSDGSYWLEFPAGSGAELFAGESSQGSAHRTLAPSDGLESVWNPRLASGAAVRGRLVGPDGTALAGTRVELARSDAGHLRLALLRTDADGRFTFLHVPAGRHELHLYTPDARAPVRSVSAVLGGTDLGTLALTADEVTLESVTLTLAHEDGSRPVGVELRGWHVASGRGWSTTELDEAGRLRADGLARGEYELELVGPLGTLALGRRWIEDELDLGRVLLPPAGLLRIAAELRPAQAGDWLALASVQPTLEVAVEEGECLVDLPRALRPGSYVLARGTSEGSAEPLHFEVPAGRVVTITGSATEPVRATIGAPAPAPGDATCSSCHL